MVFLFISRHTPNEQQVRLASEQGHTLLHVGDVDAFDVEAVRKLLANNGDADGVVCVHPRIVTIAAQAGWVFFGFFRNVNRAPVGEKPQFETDLFVVDKFFEYKVGKIVEKEVSRTGIDAMGYREN